MEQINIQYRVFSYEKIKVNMKKRKLYFYKNDLLSDRVNEEIYELKNKSLLEAHKRKMPHNKKWLTQASQLARQAVMEFNLSSHQSLAESTLLLKVIDDYIHRFSRENSQLVLYQAFLLKETNKLQLVLNFFIRFTYQAGQFIEASMSEALVKQGISRQGNAVGNWKAAEIKKLKLSFLEKQESNQVIAKQQEPVKVQQLVEKADMIDENIGMLVSETGCNNIELSKMELDQLTSKIESIESKEQQLADSYQLSVQAGQKLKQQDQYVKAQLVQSLAQLKNESKDTQSQLAEVLPKPTRQTLQSNLDCNNKNKKVAVTLLAEGGLSANQLEFASLAEAIANLETKNVMVAKWQHRFADEADKVQRQVYLLQQEITAKVQAYQVTKEQNKEQVSLLSQQLVKAEELNKRLERTLANSIKQVKNENQGTLDLESVVQEMLQRLKMAKNQEIALAQQLQQEKAALVTQKKLEEATISELMETIKQLEQDKRSIEAQANQKDQQLAQCLYPEQLVIPVEIPEVSSDYEEKQATNISTRKGINQQNQAAFPMPEDEHELKIISPSSEEPLEKIPQGLSRRRTKKISPKVCSELYRKVQFIEHAWMIHLDLLEESNQMKPKNPKLSSVDEQLKAEIDTQELESFIYNDEAVKLKERFTTSKRPFGKTTINLTIEDYQTLITKARQYDLLEYFNKLLSASCGEPRLV